uniref:Lipopolysaccharide biosynthesis n=1 Tax=Rheinheimera sp. BAL341 TaxID=1708203 RepID=A0A486XVH0_9GAMM
MSIDVNESQFGYQKDRELAQLIVKFWRHKLLILAITSVFAVGGVFYALSKANVYTAQAVLFSVSEQSGLKIPGQLGGLAALAGVNIGGLSGGGDKTKVALEVLKSREFITRFIERHDLLVSVMAAKGWVQSDNTLLIDDEIYQSSTQTWVRTVKAPFEPKPSLLEAYKVFEDMLKVSEDKTSGMITLSLTHYSPFLAKQIVDDLIKDLNSEMRNQEKNEALNSIEYLTNQIEKTSLAEVKTMLYSLIEEQTKTLMLANVRDEYVFKVIDPAVVEEEKSGPMRAFIVILFCFLGGFLSLITVLVFCRD